MRWNLRYRLLVAPVLLLIGTAAATAWAASHAAATAERQIVEKIHAVEMSVQGPPTFRLTQPILRQMRGLTGVELMLASTNGDIVSTFDEPIGLLNFPQESEPIVIHEVAYRYSQIPIRAPHPNEGSTLITFYPEAQRRAAIREAVQPALWLGVGGGGLTFILALLTSRRLVARIRDIEARTREIAEGKLEPIPLPTTDDEVRDLVRSVNEMSRKIADYQTELQQTERLRILGQFSGGLAHQLRNAASGARLAIQLYLNDAPYSDVEALNVALRQLGRMETNLSQFLDLGRPDEPRMEELDLVTVLDDAVESLRPQACHAGTQLTWEKPVVPILTVGHATQLGHLLTNLLSNAVEAAGPGGDVDCRVEQIASVLRIAISDSGPGPPPSIAGKLFEAFVTGREQGVGLGLAVAKQAADSHHGRIFWERVKDRTRFVVELKHTTRHDSLDNS